ncbi:MAG: hypothetical protein JWR80_9657 [Bradyrhizobium sp.]|nr:hypothetical protein [Bradyrhizobium sp.]
MDLTNDEIINRVKAAYVKARKIGEGYLKNVEVTTMSPCTGGKLICVAGEHDDGSKGDEICFISVRGDVKIFDSTPQLLDYLENIGSVRAWLMSGQAVAAGAFLVTLLAVILLAFFPAKNAELSTVLGHVLTLAAGFFFGNQVAHRR